MRGTAVALLVFLACCSSVSCTLYALVTETGGGGSQVNMYTVSVDTTTGNWSDPIVENFVYIFESITFDGISAFDSSRSIYYYATDWPAAFVYGTDLINKQLLPPIYVGATQVSEIAYDHATDQLFITGLFGTQYYMMNVSYTSDMPTSVVLNYTEKDIQFSYCHTIDASKAIYYIVYFNGANQLMMGQFPTNNPSNFTSAPLHCQGISPEYIAYDVKLGKYVGIGFGHGIYYYYEIVNGKCWTHSFLIINPGFMDMVYDYDATTLYFSYFCAEGDFLGIYEVTNHTFTTFPMMVVSDLESSFSM
jgi:hypothetical protein